MTTNGFAPDVHPVLGADILARATAAYSNGAPLFSCTVQVASIASPALSLRSSPTAAHRHQTSPDRLLAVVESLSWHLTHVDHVWVQTAQAGNAGWAGIAGHVEAHYLFRRAAPST